MASLVWGSGPAAQLIVRRLESERLRAFAPQRIRSLSELEERRSKKDVVIVDAKTLAEGGEQLARFQPVVVLCEAPLGTAVGWLQHPWVSHVINAAMLEHPLVETYLDHVMTTITSSRRPRLLDWVGNATGRRVRLTHANRRADRIEKMSEFFASNGVGERTQAQLRDVAEELLTNAFYDAPVSAGALKKPVSRSVDIALPDDSACDLAYGCREDLAFVRVRDPFGSLTRRRLVEVLLRCSQPDMQVQVDESMGGAGLGLWRLFSVATFLAVSVNTQQNTDILVGIAKKTGVKPFAFHLFFREGQKRRFWHLFDEETSKPSVNKSIVLGPR